MSKCCLVKGCKNIDIAGFIFPSEGSPLHTLWMSTLEKHQKVPENYKDYKICSLHFSSADFAGGNRESMQLTETAVPRIFPKIDLDSLPSPGYLMPLKDEPADIEDLPHNTFLDTDDDDSSSDFDAKYMQTFFTQVKTEMDLEERSEDMDTYESIDWEDDSESDYESVSETDVAILKESVRKKTEELKRSENAVQSMLEMIRKQEETISKLEVELEALLKANECKVENEKFNKVAQGDDNEGSRAKQPRMETSNNFDLQSFAMSLYYFSPNVYAYVRSLIPHLPSQSDILNWVKNGQASEIFPPGVLDFDKISLD